MRTADPAHVALMRDLSFPEFVDAQDAGRWRIVETVWPHVVFAIRAGDGREFGIRVDFEGYPAVCPAGTPWHVAENRALTLAELPTGGDATRTFRSDWSIRNGLTPYTATERVCLTSHGPAWGATYPDRMWHPGRSVTFYLQRLHVELAGCQIPEAG